MSRQRAGAGRSSGNLACGLRRRRRRGDPMADYDRLPPALRGWLAGAVLPWSARSARRVYTRALVATGGCERAALAQLSALEARRLAQEGVPQV